MICYKCGGYGHYGRECPAADKDMEEFANKIVGRIEHTFQAYTPVTLQYMNDVIAKAAKLDQSRRVAKTKAKLLQGIMNQRGGAQRVPKTPFRGRGRGAPKVNVAPPVQPQGPPAGRGRGRGAANFVAKRTRQPNVPQAQATPLQPMAPPLPSLRQNITQSSDSIKVEPNPFLSNNPFVVVDSHLPNISEIQDEIEDEELEGMTLKELDALQQALDENLEENLENQDENEEK